MKKNINNNFFFIIAFLSILLFTMTSCSVKPIAEEIVTGDEEIVVEEDVIDVVTENSTENNPENDNDTNDINDNILETIILYLSTDKGVTRFNVFDGNEGLNQYASYHEYVNDEKGHWVIIVPDKTVTNFEFIKVGDYIVDDNMLLYLDYVVHPVGELTPEKPFLVKTYTHWGERPGYGVSYNDSNNFKRYFYLFQSMMDHADDDDSEGFRLIEFTNVPPTDQTEK